MNFSKLKEVNYSSDENMISTYNNMNNMRKQQVLCDLNIKIGSKIMAVHKIVLASNSEYFNKMFTSDFKESHENEITINEVESEALELLVEYAYTSKLKITERNVQDLLVASNFLLFDRNIFTECLKFLKDIVNADNCFIFKDFAYLNNIGELQEFCNSYILENFGAISISSQFLLLTFDQIFELIQSDYINASEVKIYESIMRWVKHDLKHRLNSLQLFMKHISFSLIPAAYFMDHIENEEILKAKCKDLLYETLKLYSSNYAKSNLSLSNKFCERRRMCSSEQLIVLATSDAGTGNYTFNWMSTNDHKIHDLFKMYDCTNASLYILSDGRVVLCQLYDKRWYSKIYDGKIKEWIKLPDFPEYEDIIELKNHLYMLDLSSDFFSCNMTGNVLCPVRKQYPGDLGHLVKSDEFIYCFQSQESGWEVLQYNPNDDDWSVLSHTNDELEVHSSLLCYLNGFIYILGGNKSRSKIAWMFNISTCVWSQIANMEVGICYAGGAAVAVNGLIYVFGGQKCSLIETYDPQTNKWTLKQCKSNMNINTAKQNKTKAIVLNPESNINAKNILNYYSNITTRK